MIQVSDSNDPNNQIHGFCRQSLFVFEFLSFARAHAFGVLTLSFLLHTSTQTQSNAQDRRRRHAHGRIVPSCRGHRSGGIVPGSHRHVSIAAVFSFVMFFDSSYPLMRRSDFNDTKITYFLLQTVLVLNVVSSFAPSDLDAHVESRRARPPRAPTGT